MRIRTTIGKAVVLGAMLATAGVWGGDASEGRIHRVYGFEETPLGEFPKGVFASLWGGFGAGTFIYVTNLHASEGEKALVWNLMPHADMAGMGLPLVRGRTNGVLTVAFDYYRESFGLLNFEFRSPEGKWPFFTLSSGLVVRGKNYRWGGTSGEIKPFRWYRVTFTYPLTKADGDRATITVVDKATGEKAAEGGWDDWLMKDPSQQSWLFFNCHNATPSRQTMYVDDLTVDWR